MALEEKPEDPQRTVLYTLYRDKIFQSGPKLWTDRQTIIAISRAMLLAWLKRNLDSTLFFWLTLLFYIKAHVSPNFLLFNLVCSSTCPFWLILTLLSLFWKAVAPRSLLNKGQFSFPIRVRWVLFRGRTWLLCGCVWPFPSFSGGRESGAQWVLPRGLIIIWPNWVRKQIQFKTKTVTDD